MLSFAKLLRAAAGTGAAEVFYTYVDQVIAQVITDVTNLNDPEVRVDQITVSVITDVTNLNDPEVRVDQLFALVVHKPHHFGLLAEGASTVTWEPVLEQVQVDQVHVDVMFPAAIDATVNVDQVHTDVIFTATIDATVNVDQVRVDVIYRPDHFGLLAEGVATVTWATPDETFVDQVALAVVAKPPDTQEVVVDQVALAVVASPVDSEETLVDQVVLTVIARLWFAPFTASGSASVTWDGASVFAASGSASATWDGTTV